MTRFKNLLHKRTGLIVLVAIVVVAAFGFYRGGSEEEVVSGALVVHTVEEDAVTTGIQTTGKIAAANILDLNVYKLTTRIDAVGVINGMYVEEGELLFAFDQSDVSVDIAESRLAVEEAQLALDVEQSEAADPNTTIATLENDIVVLERNLVQYDKDLKTELRDFLNEDLEAEPTSDRYDEQVSETAPVVGGLYTSDEDGEYHIEVYKSGAESGYSYNLRGLETGTHEVYLDVATPLGVRGLTITFSTVGINARDEWIVAVPNVHASEYPENIENYTKAIEDLQEDIKSDTVTLANKRTQLAQAERGDTSEQRNLTVEAAALAIEKARVDLQKGYDTQDERRIIAPFSGTIEDMENVVIGATPTRDTNDPIDFGVLISDEFLTSFSLSANDVDKITLGQKVLVTLTSVPDSVPLTAEVIEISSLPDSSAVAQYEVSARIVVNNNTDVRLRDGMLADIEIVQEEVQDVVRVPLSAVSYREGKTYVTVLEGFSDEQQRQIERIGIIRTENSTHTSYEREVTLGLRGQYYAEVLDGLAVGEVIEVASTNTATTEADTPVVRAGFGGGSGGGRPPRNE